MDTLTPRKTVHYYDTNLHLILCGLRGFEARSTKHSRDVTCNACVGLLRDRPALAAASGSSSAAGSGAP
jgi:hypothetical protein